MSTAFVVPGVSFDAPISELRSALDSLTEPELSQGVSFRPDKKQEIRGTKNNDRILFPGSNGVFAGRGDDLIKMQKDTFPGSSGHTVFGGAGKDIIVGGSGDDFLYGDLETPFESGSLRWFSTDGENDTIFAGHGNDQVFGGGGNDRLLGEAGDDYLRGDHGDDLIRGGTGNDILVGSFGSDRLFGGAGDDLLTAYAGIGSFPIDSPAGSINNPLMSEDYLKGGKGNDLFLLENSSGVRATIADFKSGEDRLLVTEHVAKYANVTIVVEIGQKDTTVTVQSIAGVDAATYTLNNVTELTRDDFQKGTFNPTTYQGELVFV